MFDEIFTIELLDHPEDPLASIRPEECEKFCDFMLSRGVKTWPDHKGTNPEIVHFDENEDRDILRKAIEEYNNRRRR